MFKYITAETVSPGHPDKIADLISDYVLTKALENNPLSRVAAPLLKKKIFQIIPVTSVGKSNYKFLMLVMTVLIYQSQSYL